MQARFYLPMWGRFASPDPARDQHFEETQSWNIYSYVQNNPISNIDPSGMVDLNLLNPKARGYGLANEVKSKAGVYTIVGHGRWNRGTDSFSGFSDGMGNVISLDTVAKMIKQDPKFDPTMTVQLVVCHAGAAQIVSEGNKLVANDESAAQKLSDKIDAPVEASAQTVSLSEPDKKGEAQVLNKDGKPATMMVFTPKTWMEVPGAPPKPKPIEQIPKDL